MGCALVDREVSLLFRCRRLWYSNMIHPGTRRIITTLDFTAWCTSLDFRTRLLLLFHIHLHGSRDEKIPTHCQERRRGVRGQRVAIAIAMSPLQALTTLRSSERKYH